MISLVAGAVAAFGGRWWLSVGTFSTRLPAPALWSALTLSSLISAAAAAALGANVATHVHGPGLLLFLALSLLSAAFGLVWPTKPLAEGYAASARGPVAATILLLAGQISDGAPFIILAVAARTGNPWLATIGGFAGLMAAGASAVALIEEKAWLKRLWWVRLPLGCALILIGLVTALSAMNRW